jgi:hypothetical protein
MTSAELDLAQKGLRFEGQLTTSISKFVSQSFAQLAATRFLFLLSVMVLEQQNLFNLAQLE